MKTIYLVIISLIVSCSSSKNIVSSDLYPEKIQELRSFSGDKSSMDYQILSSHAAHDSYNKAKYLLSIGRTEDAIRLLMFSGQVLFYRGDITSLTKTTLDHYLDNLRSDLNNLSTDCASIREKINFLSEVSPDNLRGILSKNRCGTYSAKNSNRVITFEFPTSFSQQVRVEKLQVDIFNEWQLRQEKAKIFPRMDIINAGFSLFSDYYKNFHIFCRPDRLTDRSLSASGHLKLLLNCELSVEKQNTKEKSKAYCDMIRDALIYEDCPGNRCRRQENIITCMFGDDFYAFHTGNYHFSEYKKLLGFPRFPDEHSHPYTVGRRFSPSKIILVLSMYYGQVKRDKYLVFNATQLGWVQEDDPSVYFTHDLNRGKFLINILPEELKDLSAVSYEINWDRSYALYQEK